MDNSSDSEVGGLVMPKSPAEALRQIQREQMKQRPGDRGEVSTTGASSSKRKVGTVKTPKPQMGESPNGETRLSTTGGSPINAVALGDLLSTVLSRAKPTTDKERQSRLSIDLDEELMDWLKIHCAKHKVKQRQVIHALLTVYRESVENP
jgi:hypothetical protein